MSEACAKLDKLVEHFHGDDDAVFGDVTLLKYHVRQVNGVNWPTIRHFNQGTGYGSSAYPKKTSHATVRKRTG